MMLGAVILLRHFHFAKFSAVQRKMQLEETDMGHVFMTRKGDATPMQRCNTVSG